MVAKATQNLFDVNIGGAGFHVTSHLLALAALFIACFAIAGYISFRDDSVPDSALKAGADSVHHIETTVSPGILGASATLDVDVGTLPAGAIINTIYVVVNELTVSTGATLKCSFGTATTSDRFTAPSTIMTGGTLDVAYDTIGDALMLPTNTEDEKGALAGNNVARDVIVRFTESAGVALTTGGSYTVKVLYTTVALR